MLRGDYEQQSFVPVENIRREALPGREDVGRVEDAWGIGDAQMTRFLTADGPHAEFPTAWVGGRDGRGYRLGRTMCYHPFDLVQTWGAIRNRVHAALLNDQSVEVRGKRGQEYVVPDLFDLVAMQATLEGALSAVQDHPDGNEAYRARVHLERLLAGERFHKESGRGLLISDAPNRPDEEKLVGAVVLLWSLIDGQPRILMQEEENAKPHFDKQQGDMSLLAEGRRPFEPIGGLIRRMVGEEIGWGTNTMLVDPHPLGYYRFKRHPQLPQGGWICALEARVDPFVVATSSMHATDGETHNHMWISPDTIVKEVPLRGAMLGVVSDWLEGRRDVVASASPGRHAGKTVFEFSADGVTGFVNVV